MWLYLELSLICQVAAHLSKEDTVYIILQLGVIVRSNSTIHDTIVCKQTNVGLNVASDVINIK